MKIGISSWAFPWAVGVPGHPQPSSPLTAAGLVERAAELQAEVVQIADNLPLDSLSEVGLKAIANAARASNIAVELGTKGLDPNQLRRYLQLCRRLGAILLRTLPPAARMPERELRRNIESVLPEFERAGVVLVLENYESYQTAELAGVVQAIGSDALGICLDTVNSFGALEGLHEAVRNLAPHVRNVHVKDFDVVRIPSRMGFSVEGRPAGDGRLGVAWLLAQLRPHGRHFNLIVEHWPPFVGSIGETIDLEAGWARRSMGYLRALRDGGSI